MSEVKPPVMGVAVEDFTDDVWTGIATAYFRSALLVPEEKEVDAGYWYHMNAQSILDGHGEYRLGSVISMHSKLVVCDLSPDLLHFNFHDNADPVELSYAEEHRQVTPESIQIDFRDRVATFLTDLGLAREIIDCPDL